MEGATPLSLTALLGKSAWTWRLCDLTPSANRGAPPATLKRGPASGGPPAYALGGALADAPAAPAGALLVDSLSALLSAPPTLEIQSLEEAAAVLSATESQLGASLALGGMPGPGDLAGSAAARAAEIAARTRAVVAELASGTLRLSPDTLLLEESVRGLHSETGQLEVDLSLSVARLSREEAHLNSVLSGADDVLRFARVVGLAPNDSSQPRPPIAITQLAPLTRARITALSAAVDTLSEREKGLIRELTSNPLARDMYRSFADAVKAMAHTEAGLARAIEGDESRAERAEDALLERDKRSRRGDAPPSDVSALLLSVVMLSQVGRAHRRARDDVRVSAAGQVSHLQASAVCLENLAASTGEAVAHLRREVASASAMLQGCKEAADAAANEERELLAWRQQVVEVKDASEAGRRAAIATWTARVASGRAAFNNAVAYAMDATEADIEAELLAAVSAGTKSGKEAGEAALAVEKARTAARVAAETEQSSLSTARDAYATASADVKARLGLEERLEAAARDAGEVAGSRMSAAAAVAAEEAALAAIYTDIDRLVAASATVNASHAELTNAVELALAAQRPGGAPEPPQFASIKSELWELVNSLGVDMGDESTWVEGTVLEAALTPEGDVDPVTALATLDAAVEAYEAELSLLRGAPVGSGTLELHHLVRNAPPTPAPAQLRGAPAPRPLSTPTTGFQVDALSRLDAVLLGLARS